MVDLSGIFATLQKYEIIDFFVPFMLVFALVYAALLKTKIFGEGHDVKGGKNFYTLIAFSFALLSIAPHMLIKYGIETNLPDIVVVMKQAFPSVSILLLVILSVCLVIGLFGAKMDLMQNGLGGGLLAFLVAVVVFIYLKAAGLLDKIPIIGELLGGDSELWNLVVVFAVFGIIVWLITREEKKPGDGFGDKLKGLFNKL